MSDPRDSEPRDTDTDSGVNATGSQSDPASPDWGLVDSGQSDDIENSLTGQGVADRETLADIRSAEDDDEGDGERV